MISLFSEIEKINQEFQARKAGRDLSRDHIRKLISQHGSFVKLGKEDNADLVNLRQAGALVAVDGSVNRYGSLAPHYLELYQAVAIKDNRGQDRVVVTDHHSPFLEADMEEETSGQRDLKLAELEIDAALQAFDQWRPKLIFMDGSLIRLQMAAAEKMEELKTKAFASQTILCGIIEEIKTDTLFNLEEENSVLHYYDKEALHSILDLGEAALIEEEYSNKGELGFASAFLRSSQDPMPIGVDIFIEQKDQLKNLLTLVYQLTETSSRGIPLIMDLVDLACRIEDKEMEYLIKNRLNPEIAQEILLPKREKRGW